MVIRRGVVYSKWGWLLHSHGTLFWSLIAVTRDDILLYLVMLSINVIASILLLTGELTKLTIGLGRRMRWSPAASTDAQGHLPKVPGNSLPEASCGVARRRQQPPALHNTSPERWWVSRYIEPIYAIHLEKTIRLLFSVVDELWQKSHAWKRLIFF